MSTKKAPRPGNPGNGALRESTYFRLWPACYGRQASAAPILPRRDRICKPGSFVEANPSENPVDDALQKVIIPVRGHAHVQMRRMQQHDVAQEAVQGMPSSCLHMVPQRRHEGRLCRLRREGDRPAEPSLTPEAASQRSHLRDGRNQSIRGHGIL